MKGRVLLCLIITLSVMLTAMPALKASPYTSMEVLFVAINDVPITPTSELIGPPPKECDNITVAIHITDAVDLWSWKVRVTWDNTVLEILDLAQGEFHPALPTLFLGVPNQPVGEIPELSDTSIAVPKTGVTGTGNLAYIRFHLQDMGMCYIRILDVIGLNVAGDEITIDPITHGHLELWYLRWWPPHARFTPKHCTFVYVCENVTLDARMSEGGWDSVPELGEYCPIVEYKWEIDEGCDGSIDLTLYGEYLVDGYHCSAAGDVCINLTVYAPDPTAPDTYPDYYPYDTEIHVIHQIPRPIGAAIDVFTDRGGEGPGYDPLTHEPWPYKTSWSDAYGPQEEVTVCALVTYDNEPVEHKLVAFEVKDPTGTTILTRTNFSNSDGIACVEFRIPWEGGDAEDMFGIWAIIGTVDVAGDVVDDICPFKFGYILNINEVIITGSPLYKTDPLSISVDIDNLSWNHQDTFLTIVLYSTTNAACP